MLSFCESFQTILPATRLINSGGRNLKLSAVPSSLDAIYSLILADAESSYKYGEVVAPSWVLPVGAVLVILTAAIPILLRPGEKALEQQRENERTTNSKFNKRSGKDLL
eukprot:gene8111-10986_t